MRPRVRTSWISQSIQGGTLQRMWYWSMREFSELLAPCKAPTNVSGQVHRHPTLGPGRSGTFRKQPVFQSPWEDKPGPGVLHQFWSFQACTSGHHFKRNALQQEGFQAQSCLIINFHFKYWLVDLFKFHVKNITNCLFKN